jgi:Domain of unknown function (DUF4365)
MPRYPRTHQLETESRLRLREAFTRAGWVTEDLDEDYGEDMLVRIFEEGYATAYAFFVQAKATDHIHKYLSSDQRYVRYPIGIEHLNHWQSYWEPVVFTVYDAQSNDTYWETVQSPELTIQPRKNAKSVSLKVPTDNLIDEEGLRRIAARTKHRFERFEREQQGAEVLVELLQETLGVKVEYDPQGGVLIVEQADGSANMTIFGKLAEKVAAMTTNTGSSADELVVEALTHGLDLEAEFDRGAGLVVTDESGRVVTEWTSSRDFHRAMARQVELDE